MSFTFCAGVSKSQLLYTLLHSPNDAAIEHLVRGNSVWAIKTDAQGRYIVYFLLCSGANCVEQGRASQTSGWGYRAVPETESPPLNCPIEFLLATEPRNATWRKSVRQYHQAHSRTPVVGEIWSLKDSPIPHITISAVAPRLAGTYAGRTYKLTPSRLRMPLAQAFMPRLASRLKGGVR